jgi:hypothetical protein
MRANPNVSAKPQVHWEIQHDTPENMNPQYPASALGYCLVETVLESSSVLSSDYSRS